MGKRKADVAAVPQTTTTKTPASRKSPAPQKVVAPDDTFDLSDTEASRRALKRQAIPKPLDSLELDRGRLSKTSDTIEQHLMKQTVEAKEALRGFKEGVTEGGVASIEFIRRLMGVVDKTSAEQEEMDYKALEATSVSVDIEDTPLFLQTQEILRHSRNMLSRHEAVEKSSQYPDLVVPTQTWKRDTQKLSELVAYGLRHGEKLVESHLGPGPKEQAVETPDEAECLAPELFEQTMKAVGLRTWGQIANEQMEALTGVVLTAAGTTKE